jgi:hypothetical protein
MYSFQFNSTVKLVWTLGQISTSTYFLNNGQDMTCPLPLSPVQRDEKDLFMTFSRNYFNKSISYAYSYNLSPNT